MTGPSSLHPRFDAQFTPRCPATLDNTTCDLPAAHSASHAGWRLEDGRSYRVRWARAASLRGGRP